MPAARFNVEQVTAHNDRMVNIQNMDDRDLKEKEICTDKKKLFMGRPIFQQTLNKIEFGVCEQTYSFNIIYCKLEI